MDKNLMDALYMEHNKKFGVMSANDERVITRVLNTDLTLWYDRRKNKVYLLVPLTKMHKIECHTTLDGSDTIIVDGKVIQSDNFFRKDACQWIEIDNDTLSKVA